MGPETPRASKQGKIRADSRDLGPHRGPGPPTPARTPLLPRRGPELPRGPKARARAQAFRWKTRAPTAFNTGGQGVLCRCCMRDSFCQASLCTTYYQGAQCSCLCRTRAEPVCSIKLIRRHGTFPSCRLRRKLHSPFRYVASYTSYVWHRPDKTAPGHDERGTPGAGKGIQERDLLCLRRHNI